MRGQLEARSQYNWRKQAQVRTGLNESRPSTEKRPLSLLLVCLVLITLWPGEGGGCRMIPHLAVYARMLTFTMD